MELQEVPPRRITLQSCLLSEWRICRDSLVRRMTICIVSSPEGFQSLLITRNVVSGRRIVLLETINKEGSKQRGDGGIENDEGKAEGISSRAGQVGTLLVGLDSIQMGLQIIIFF
ncbi:hypothetical protein S83_054230 [Arachis hypogaea]